ncbi:MAG: hypothetical protein KKC46_08455 [Proteobacteria bacterium]|nr:hypothetical protein [Pseudomonadota bacterium]
MRCGSRFEKISTDYMDREMSNHGDLEFDPHECDLSDLALAAITLSGFPLTLEKAIPDAYFAP